jgi:putative phosphoribosyl transferase
MTPLRRYRDRHEAGKILADHVAERMPPRGEDEAPPIVLGLPRGGVPVAAPVAARLGAPLDVLTVRKIGTPHHEELAIGAVASGGLRVLNDELIAHLGVPPSVVEERTNLALRELEQREARLRGDRPPVPLAGRTVVVVDDGLATGATMRAAVRALRSADAATVVVAVPVGAPDSCGELEALADLVVCPRRPVDFSAVGQWYDDFSATTDAEVIELLNSRSEPPQSR